MAPACTTLLLLALTLTAPSAWSAPSGEARRHFGPIVLRKGSPVWEMAGIGFPEALMVDLKFVPSQRVLVAATHGLGIFYLQLPQ